MTQATVAVLSLASAALTVESQLLQMDVGVSDCCRVLGCFLVVGRDLGEG